MHIAANPPACLLDKEELMTISNPLTPSAPLTPLTSRPSPLKIFFLFHRFFTGNFVSSPKRRSG